MRRFRSRKLYRAAAVALAVVAAPASSAPAVLTCGENPDAEVDAYIAGRLMTAYALSEHLGPYRIGVVVHEGGVTINGIVENDVQRELALEIARGVEEIGRISSNVRVDPDAARAEEDPVRDEDGFAQRFGDAAVSARIKVALLLNDETGGAAIDVVTRSGVVTLDGEVASDAERELAGEIARNARGAKRVENRLAVEHPGERTIGQAR